MLKRVHPWRADHVDHDLFAVSIGVWALAYFPRHEAAVEGPFAARRTEIAEQILQLQTTTPDAESQLATLVQEQATIENQIAGDYMRQSWLGRAGHWIEPVVRPLGWDWRIGCAVIASFPAREVVVGTLSVIYNLGQDGDPGTLGQVLLASRWEGTERPVFTLPVSLSLMVFFALCAQCVSTLVVIRRETASWHWPVFCFVYMTILAYLGALDRKRVV